MLRKVLLAAAATMLVGAVTLVSYDDASARRHVRHALRAADTMMPVLDTGSLLAAIRSLAPRHPLRIDA